VRYEQYSEARLRRRWAGIRKQTQKTGALELVCCLVPQRELVRETGEHSLCS
jgi:hypothetical protein